MLAQEFVRKWSTLVQSPGFTEIAYYQQHLIDLCLLVGHPLPASADAENKPFRFEQRVAIEDTQHSGRADAWYKGHFAIEYKGPGADLDKAYRQLQGYRAALHNPPLLIVCDFRTLVIYPNFNDSINRPITITLDDLPTPEGLFRLRSLFYDPPALRSEALAERVTTQAAEKFGRLAALLEKWRYDPHDVAHYLIRLLFCLFAEDVGLLPPRTFSDLVANGVHNPGHFNRPIRDLFHAMAEGDFFGKDKILYFNGGLFDDAPVLDLDTDALRILHEIAQLDWSAIEPAIFGTLFTRSLDPSQRAKLGAQYTSKEDILLIVEPVLMAPLRRQWAEVQAGAHTLAQAHDAAPTTARKHKLGEEMRALVMGFVQQVRAVRVLDPAAGSGNFLYIAMRLLMDLEQEAIHFCGAVGLQPPFPEVGPQQMHGIEINDYAHELAQTTLWIGYLQWRHDHGYGFSEPILKPLDTIKHMDAILAYDADGKPVEPEWPAADVIVGNPPFLGTKKLRGELGDKYVNSLFALYQGRIPGFSDLVCYWFEKAHSAIAQGMTTCAGLIATQGIRGGLNRVVLDRIKQTGDIFYAWSDRDWILDGAHVHISVVAFDNGSEQTRYLNGVPVGTIQSNLTSTVDTTKASRLLENVRIAFLATVKGGPFDIDIQTAENLLDSTDNEDGRNNRDVVRPWVNGLDITRRNRGMWIVDFGQLSLAESKQYKRPFEYVHQHVFPIRSTNRKATYANRWWQFSEPCIGMRRSLEQKSRYIATPALAKHRLFAWLSTDTIADHQLVVIAREDDYFFGVLQSTTHELWARSLGTQLREVESGFRYTPTTTFETYPFPWSPGQEPQDDPRVQAIAAAAAELVALRDAWLNPPGLDEKQLQKRTLTNLYNERPDWLDAAHRKLDAAVFAAYGWPDALTDEEILARLLALNLERAAGNPALQVKG